MPLNEQPGPAITIRSLSVSFATPEGPIHALKDVDLDVAPGDFISLIGPSGPCMINP